MSPEHDALATLIAKDEIRELAMLYSRGVDRQDIELLRTLYTEDGTDDHGHFYNGSAAGYVDALAASLPHISYSGHHICNHLISVAGDHGHGEVYAIAFHVFSDGKGGFVEDLMTVRYLDTYRKENGRWLFASRTVTFDMRNIRPCPEPKGPRPYGPGDTSYQVLTSRLFARGPRTAAGGEA